MSQEVARFRSMGIGLGGEGGVQGTVDKFTLISSLMWSRTTGVGVSLGCVLGAVCSISCWLIHASTYPGGLSDFIANTGTVHTEKYIYYSTYSSVHTVQNIHYSTYSTAHTVQFIQYRTYSTVHTVQYSTEQ